MFDLGPHLWGCHGPEERSDGLYYLASLYCDRRSCSISIVVEAPSTAAWPSPMTSKRRRILVVEDTRDSRQIIRDLLSHSGFEVVDVADGETGLAKARAEHPDLIIMNLEFPGLDGYEVTRRLKSDPALKAIPVIAVTSYALSGDEERSRAAGCDGYIAKPFRPANLLAVVRSFLR